MSEQQSKANEGRTLVMSTRVEGKANGPSSYLTRYLAMLLYMGYVSMKKQDRDGLAGAGIYQMLSNWTEVEAAIARSIGHTNFMLQDIVCHPKDETTGKEAYFEARYSEHQPGQMFFETAKIDSEYLARNAPKHWPKT